jgi:hypothetical protein
MASAPLRGIWIPLPQRLIQMVRLRTEMPIQWRKVIHGISEGQIMPQSQRECPVDTGALRSTGKVHNPVISKSGGIARIALTYGGVSSITGQFVHYAVIQHEAFPNKGKAINPNAKMKYLEDPINMHKPIILGALRAATLATVRKIFAT